MAKFTITIPNIGDVEVEGPFATEEGIRKLTNAINNMDKSLGTGGTKSKKTDNHSKIFDGLIDSADGTTSALERLMREAENDEDTFKKLNAGVQKSIGGLKSFMSGTQAVSGGMGKMIESFGEGSSSFLGMFGPIGGVVGGVITVFTGLIGASIGFIQGLEETNDKLMGAGAQFKGGIDEFQANARDGGIAMSSLTKAILDNGNSFRMLSGGLTGGTKTITKAFKALGNDQQDILYNMGYTTDQVLSGMADFASMAKLSGKDLNMDEVAKGGADYLKAQRELTRLTGKSADELKAQREGMRSQAEFQAFFNSIASPKLRESVENGLLAVPEASKEMVSKMLRGTPLTDPAMIQLLNQIPGIQQEFTALGASVRNGTISGEEYTTRFNAILNQLNLGSKKVVGSYGNQIDLLKQGNPMWEKFFEIAQANSASADAFNESLKSTKSAMDIVNGPQGILSGIMGVYRRYDEQINSIMQTLGATVAKIFAIDKGGYIKGVIDHLIAFAQDATKALDEWVSDPQEKFTDLWTKVWESFKKNFGDIFNATTGMMKGWFNYLTDAISSGIQKGFDAVLASIGYETDTKEQSDALKAIEKLPESMRDVIQAPQLSAAEVRSGQLTPEHRAQREAMSKMWEVDDLGRIGYVQEGSKLLGTERYRRMTPEERAKWERENDSTIVDPQAATQAPAQALGGMFEPRQGGHLVRVAEAYQPEIIAPAKRGTDGKMGLEVTGVMLDNSQLLRSLVEINKNQAGLIASLGSKIDGMTNAMDKLVYEQRQANRLAT